MTPICTWEQRDGYKRCTVCGRRYYGTAENPVAICGGHKVHGPTLRANITVPVKQPEAPAPQPCKPCQKQKEIKERLAAAKKERHGTK